MYTSVLGRQVTLCLLCVRAGPFKGTVPLCGLKLHRILVLKLCRPLLAGDLSLLLSC